MTSIQLRGHAWLALAAALLVLTTLVPSASAEDEPAFVPPCVGGLEFTAEPGQPIAFLCGWGTQGGPGLMNVFLKAYQATLIVEDEAGSPVLTIGPAEFAALWGDPESGPSGFEDVTCAGPTGQSAGWSYLLEAGLPEGTYTVVLQETLRHPITDGFHTCRLPDGTPVTSPGVVRGSRDAVSTLIVAD